VGRHRSAPTSTDACSARTAAGAPSHPMTVRCSAHAGRSNGVQGWGRAKALRMEQSSEPLEADALGAYDGDMLSHRGCFARRVAVKGVTSGLARAAPGGWGVGELRVNACMLLLPPAAACVLRPRVATSYVSAVLSARPASVGHRGR